LKRAFGLFEYRRGDPKQEKTGKNCTKSRKTNKNLRKPVETGVLPLTKLLENRIVKRVGSLGAA
jgi:hypothetical protein